MKRKPSWFDVLKWAACCFCGLLLLNLSTPVWAVANKPVAKSSVRPLPKGSQLSRSKNRKSLASVPSAAIGMAEMQASDEIGLRGSASFYGHGFQGRRVASGERFDVRAFTAASNHFPLGSWVAVRRLDSERCAIVKVNDRMLAKHKRRVIDVSRAAAEYLGMIRAGVVLVRVAPIKSASHQAKNCRAAFEVAEDCPACVRVPDVSPGIKLEQDFYTF